MHSPRHRPTRKVDPNICGIATGCLLVVVLQPRRATNCCRQFGSSAAFRLIFGNSATSSPRAPLTTRYTAQSIALKATTLVVDLLLHHCIESPRSPCRSVFTLMPFFRVHVPIRPESFVQLLPLKTLV